MKERPLVEQKLLCHSCKKVYCVLLVKSWPTLIPEKVKGSCSECVVKGREEASKRMRSSNPMKKAEVASRMAKSLRKSNITRGPITLSEEHKAKIGAASNAFYQSEKGREAKKRFSARMRKDNPMFDSSILQRMQNTIKKMRIDGEYITPTGKDHWLWRGNRNFNLYVRSLLYRTWILEVFKRDDFTCTRCKSSKKEIHAHHVRPLRKIINEVLEKEGVDSNTIWEKQEEWPRIAQLVLQEHRLEDGITLCKECHGIVDKHYKRRK